jgi:hypothetical protein
MSLLTACLPTKNNIIVEDNYCNIYKKIPNKVLLKFKGSNFTLEDMREIAYNEMQYKKKKCNEN